MDARVVRALEQLSDKYNIGYCLLHAVTAVESNGYGFLKTGEPKVLFEGHVFYRELDKEGYDARAISVANPDICYPKWTKRYYTTYFGEWQRLQRAIALNEGLAKKSASYGLFQVLGTNYSLCEYETVNDMYDAAKTTAGQVEMGIRFMINSGLMKKLQKQDWAGFARGYNGVAYAKNGYDKRLEEAYRKCLKGQPISKDL